MKPTFSLLLFLLTSCALSAPSEKESCRVFSWAKPACQRLRQIITQGNDELYISGYAWHNRYKYSPERVKNYNENAWGGGLGRGLYDEKGNWHGLYAFAFQDSHKKVEPIAGYAYLKVFHFNEQVNIGGGLTVFITARPDIYKNVPFPGVLPWFFFTCYRASIGGTYIPGAKDAGNVLFLITKFRL